MFSVCFRLFIFCPCAKSGCQVGRIFAFVPWGRAGKLRFVQFYLPLPHGLEDKMTVYWIFNGLKPCRDQCYIDIVWV